MPSERLHIATNTYPWGTFAQRDRKSFTQHTDETLAQIAAAGIDGYEPAINSPKEFDGLAARLHTHRLQMKSLYVNSTLHDSAQAEQSIAEVLAIGRVAAANGVTIIVTNPSPISWAGTQDKTDEQLATQADALNRLGQGLRRMGVTLAYHNHDSEFRAGGREFHHMLTATAEENVKFCLDAHWVFRGCGNSRLAVWDALEHYGKRIVELHIRQSSKGVWNEVFTGEGDLDYRRMILWLRERGVEPHLVLEQAVEKQSPHTMDAVQAHRLSRREADTVFA